MSPFSAHKSTLQAGTTPVDRIPRLIDHAAPMSSMRMVPETQDSEERLRGNTQAPGSAWTPDGHEGCFQSLGAEGSMPEAYWQRQQLTLTHVNQSWNLTGQYQTFDPTLPPSRSSYHPMAGNANQFFATVGDHTSIAEDPSFVVSEVPRTAVPMMPQGHVVPRHSFTPQEMPKGYQWKYIGNYNPEYAPASQLGYGPIPQGPWNGVLPKHPWKEQVPEAPMHTSRNCPQSRS
ncbi:MAG: hypothetical protein Q9186_001898 [Xanthomendoza sp. 1 TL-2023]